LKGEPLNQTNFPKRTILE